MKSFVKKKTQIYKPKWIKLKFTEYNSEYIRIRGTMKTKMNRCFCCNKGFELNDMIALACFENVGNKVLCQECAADLAE